MIKKGHEFLVPHFCAKIYKGNRMKLYMIGLSLVIVSLWSMDERAVARINLALESTLSGNWASAGGMLWHDYKLMH